jgi:glucose/arabinose dehydrogenase
MGRAADPLNFTIEGRSFDMLRNLLASGLCIAFAGLVHGSAAAQSITTAQVLSGLARPVFVTHAPGDFGRVFVIEKQGRIRIANITSAGAYTLLPTPFLDIDPIVAGGLAENSEQGLLGLAFHPNYATNGLFYVNYTAVAGAGDTVVAEFQVSANPNVANPAAVRTIITFDQPQANHNGGWIAFGPNDNYLYVATGDGGNSNDAGAGHTEPGGNAQDRTSNMLGKMLRLDVNGDDFPAEPNRNYRIPADNPFVGGPEDDEFWAYGLRNPWRPAFDRGTGDLWIADVGQNTIEEINFQPATGAGIAGRNYGWRCYEGNNVFNFDSVCQAQSNYTFPIHTYTHSQGCSITGGVVYRGCAIPTLQGTYFFADYCANTIWSLRYNGSTVSEFTNRTAALDPPGALSIASVTSFGEDAYGEMYICDSTGGEVFKMIPPAVNAPDCDANGVRDTCQILANPSLDANQNGVLDSCEPPVCPGDVNDDGRTDLADLSLLLGGFGACVGDPGYVVGADFDASGCVNLSDLSVLLGDYGCD